MSSSFGNQAPAVSYKDLLTIHGSTDNEGVEATLKRVKDGEGVDTALELSTGDLNIPTHDNSTNGLRLASTLVTASGSELNQLDDVVIGGTGANDVVTLQAAQAIEGKTIDGGTF